MILFFSDKKGKSKKHDSSDDDEAQQSGKPKISGVYISKFSTVLLVLPVMFFSNCKISKFR